MKIGFSFGRCVSDIVNGVVDFDDVLVIIARTKIYEVDEIDYVIRIYVADGYIEASYEDAVEVAKKLWYSGKIHQPRQYGTDLLPPVQTGIWMDLFPTDTSNKAVADAWKNYQLLLKLSSNDKLEEPAHLERLRRG